MNDVVRPAPVDRHVERVENQLGSQMVSHRPADNPTAVRVEYYGKVQEAGPRRNVGDIGDPELVRPLGAKVPVDEIGRRSRIAVSDGGSRPSASANPANAALSHQSSDALARHVNTLFAEIGMDVRAPVPTMRLTKERLNAIAKQQVTLPTLRRRAFAPGIVAARGDLEHTAEHGNGVVGLIRLHESEDLFGTAFVSLANQAAAFERISASSFKRLFSRRRSVSSLCSSVVKPSSRRPESRSSCLSQFMIDWRATVNSSEREFMLRPARTRSRILRRNSGGYVGRLDMLDSFAVRTKVSTEPGQLQSTQSEGELVPYSSRIDKPGTVRNTRSQEAVALAIAAFNRNKIAWLNSPSSTKYKSPSGTFASSASAADTVVGDFILVMTNLSPFITKSKWQDQIKQTPKACRYILETWPNTRYLDDLFLAFGESIDLWIGHSSIHGTDWVWPDFLKLMTRWNSKNWLLTPNLSAMAANLHFKGQFTKETHALFPLFRPAAADEGVAS